MTTLYDAILQTAMFSGVCVSGVSTTLGTPTRMIDTNRHEADGYFNGGTLFIQSGAYSNTTDRIVLYNAAETYFELEHTSGDYYPKNDNYPAGLRYTATNQNREMLVQAVNQALVHMGLYTVTDESLVSDTSSTEYELPFGVSDVVKIEEISGSGSFTPVKTWSEYSGKLYLDRPLSSGNKLRLYYNKLHNTLSQDADSIDYAFHLTRIAWTSTYFYELSRLQYLGTNANKESTLFVNAQQQMIKQERIHPVRKLERPGNMARY